MNKYEIVPVSRSEPTVTVDADRVEFERSSGRYNFYVDAEGKDPELVASYLNVNVRKLPEA
jgi:hypothetical protein